LYIYTVKYKSGIKIPDFLQNVSKKIKTFSKIKKYFIAYGQILKFFQAYFSLKKTTKKKQKLHLFHVKKKSKMDIVSSL
jgi:hypothetical protein